MKEAALVGRAELETICREVTYWQKRCEAAERFMRAKEGFNSDRCDNGLSLADCQNCRERLESERLWRELVQEHK